MIPTRGMRMEIKSLILLERSCMQFVKKVRVYRFKNESEGNECVIPIRSRDTCYVLHAKLQATWREREREREGKSISDQDCDLIDP